MARGTHSYPSRTRQLSPCTPMVLGPQGPGRVGPCQATQKTSGLRAGRLCLFCTGGHRCGAALRDGRACLYVGLVRRRMRSNGPSRTENGRARELERRGGPAGCVTASHGRLPECLSGREEVYNKYSCINGRRSEHGNRWTLTVNGFVGGPDHVGPNGRALFAITGRCWCFTTGGALRAANRRGRPRCWTGSG